MGAQRIPIAVAILPIVIGLAFVVLAIAKPDFVWTMGKVRAGREWMGETGMTVFFVGIGLALIGAGVAVMMKR